MAEVLNFGCRLNGYESDVIKKHAEVLSDEYVIINSCAVTNEAEKESYKALDRLKKAGKKVIFTGCAAQTDPHKYETIADFIIGNAEKMNADVYKSIESETFAAKSPSQNARRHEDKLFFASQSDYGRGNKDILLGKLAVGNVLEESVLHSDIVTNTENKTRAFVQIQNGCNHRCTFCIIPFGRGNSRSVPMGMVISHIKQMVESGYAEIVLTGVDITDYGIDLPVQSSLCMLIRRILKNVPDVKRLRLSSIDVAEIGQDIFDILASEERFMPYFHLSLQSGSDIILKRMKRRHLRSDILAFCEKASTIRNDIGFGADIIAGFPTESDEDFMQSLDIIRQCNIAFGHIFPFSPKNGTPAAKMPQVERKIIKERAKTLREFAKAEEVKLKNSMSGIMQSVLVESGNIGRCENFIQCEVPSDYVRGAIYQMKYL